MSRFLKAISVCILTVCLGLGSMTAMGFDASPYHLIFGEARWQTKVNNGFDALGAAITAVTSEINALSNLVTNWAVEDNIVTMIPAAATYVDGDTFTLPADYTSRFAANKVVQAQVAAGMVYSTVASSSYGGGVTTVNLNDAVLTNPITRVYVVATRDGLWPNGPGYVVARDCGSPGQTALQNAITAIGANVKTLRITDGAWALTAPVTIPANITLEFAEGAYLDLSGLPATDIQGLTSSGTVTNVAWTGHGLSTGDYVVFNGIRQYYPGVTPTWDSSGAWMNLNNRAWAITKIDDNSFSVALNSSGATYSFAAYDPGTDPGTVAAVIRVQGKVSVGLQRILSHTGACPRVRFENKNNLNLYPEWWGAVGDDSTDDILPVKQAIAAGMVTQNAVVRLSHLYYVSDTVSVNDNQGYVHLKGLANSLTGFRSKADGYPAFEVLGTAFVEFTDFCIIGNNASTAPSTLVPSVLIMEGRSMSYANSGNYSWTNIQLRGWNQYGEIYNQCQGLVKYNNIDSICQSPSVGSGLNHREFGVCFTRLNKFSLAARNGDLSIRSSDGMSLVWITNSQFTHSVAGGGAPIRAGIAAYLLDKATGVSFRNVYTGAMSLLGASGSDIWQMIDSHYGVLDNCQIESNHRYTINISSSVASTRILDIQARKIGGSSYHEAFLITDANTSLNNCYFANSQTGGSKIVLGGGSEGSTYLAGYGMKEFKCLAGNFQNNTVELGFDCKVFDILGCGSLAYNNIIRDMRSFSRSSTIIDGNLRVGQPDAAYGDSIIFLNGMKMTKGSAAPTTGSWTHGSVIWNTAPASGQPLLWSCVLDNTFGTLNSGATTGAITTAKNRLSVNSITGLTVGNWIDIAGVTGPLCVNNIIYKTDNIAGLSKAAACVVTERNHGLVEGDSVESSGITQAEWTACNGTHLITYIDANTFSIPVDTSGFAADYSTTDPGVFYIRIAVLSGNADATVGPAAAVSFHNHTTLDAFEALNLP